MPPARLPSCYPRPDRIGLNLRRALLSKVTLRLHSKPPKLANMNRMRLIAAWLLMLALPVQGMAAHALVMACDSLQSPAVQQTHQDHGGHAAGHDHDSHGAAVHHQDNSETAGSSSGHSCCHHASTGVLPTAHAGMPESPREIPGSVQLLTTLHIPELPQRPPRA